LKRISLELKSIKREKLIPFKTTETTIIGVILILPSRLLKHLIASLPNLLNQRGNIEKQTLLALDLPNIKWLEMEIVFAHAVKMSQSYIKRSIHWQLIRRAARSKRVTKARVTRILFRKA
jgi:hypothetical protein